jgi:hypothetical protein
MAINQFVCIYMPSTLQHIWEHNRERTCDTC